MVVEAAAAVLVIMVEIVDMEVEEEEDKVMATRAAEVMVAAAETAVVDIMTITTMAMETLEVVSSCQS